MNSGVLYVATGHKKYVEQANNSVKTLKSNNDINAGIYSTRAESKYIDEGHFDDIIIGDECHKDMRDKIVALMNSPYEKTVYLDSDTTVLADISQLFQILDSVDIAFRHSSRKNRLNMPGIPDAFPELGTGIIPYNNTDEVIELFDEWLNELEKQMENGQPNATIPNKETNELVETFGRDHDQIPLRKVLYESDIRFSILPTEYMFGPWGQSYAHFDVKIIHGTDNVRRNLLKEKINNRLGQRIYIGGRRGKIIYKGGGSERVYPVSLSLSRTIAYLFPSKLTKKFSIHRKLKSVYSKIESNSKS